MAPEGEPKPKPQEQIKERLSRVQQLIVARSQDAASLVRTWMHQAEDEKKKKSGTKR